MPGSWPEPFGLVAIEALACGTPVVARRIGALPEIIRDGVDGFFGDDVTAMAFKVDRVGDLDREAIRGVGHRSVLGRADDRRLRGDLPNGCSPGRRWRRRARPPGDAARGDGGTPDEVAAVISADRLASRRADRLGATTGAGH